MKIPISVEQFTPFIQLTSCGQAMPEARSHDRRLLGFENVCVHTLARHRRSLKAPAKVAFRFLMPT